MKQELLDENRAQRAAVSREKLTAPATPFVAPSYAEVVRVAATAIANEFMRVEHNALPNPNVLRLVPVDFCEMCIRLASVSVDAVSEHARKVAAQAGRKAVEIVDGLVAEQIPAEPVLYACRGCGAKEAARTGDKTMGVWTLRYECGAEDLAFDLGTDKQRVRTRRECPVVKLSVVKHGEEGRGVTNGA